MKSFNADNLLFQRYIIDVNREIQPREDTCYPMQALTRPFINMAEDGEKVRDWFDLYNNYPIFECTVEASGEFCYANRHKCRREHSYVDVNDYIRQNYKRYKQKFHSKRHLRDCKEIKIVLLNDRSWLTGGTDDFLNSCRRGSRSSGGSHCHVVMQKHTTHNFAR